MSSVIREPRSTSRSRNLSNFGGLFRNLLRRLGFATLSPDSASNLGRNMSSTAHSRRHFLQMPRDYVRRRHFFRHVSNIAIIVVMSVAAAYFITRQSGGPGFSPPRLLKRQPCLCHLRPLRLP